MRNFLWVLSALAAIGGGWLFFRGSAATLRLATVAAPETAVPVRTATVEVRDTPLSVTAIGTVQPFNSVTVRARVDGQLDKVAFTEGQDVRHGDLLVQIDPRPFETQLRAAIAQKDKDAAQLANMERDLARFSDLANRGAVPAQTLDATRAQVDQLNAALAGDQAQIDNSRLQLDYTTIRAPLDGRTGARLVDAGNMVHASDSNGLVQINQIHPISVSFTVPQDLLPALVAGQHKAPLKVTALSRDSNQQLGVGELSLIDNQIDPTTGTIRCKATFDNADNRLWPGQFVVARVVLDIQRGALTVPATAVQLGTDGPYVFVIKEGGVADLRPVEIVPADAERDVVTRGLSAGERVVTEGQYKLEAGTLVRVTDQPPPAH